MNVQIAQVVKESLIGQMEEMRKAIESLAEPLTEAQFWSKPLDPGNSFGHLVLHLTGNLSHFAGARLGNTGYVRDREREFTEANPPGKDEALRRLTEAVGVYRQVVEAMTPEAMLAAHPDARMGTALNSFFVMLTHFSLHRGQMSYLVRLVGADASKEAK